MTFYLGCVCIQEHHTSNKLEVKIYMLCCWRCIFSVFLFTHNYAFVLLCEIHFVQTIIFDQLTLLVYMFLLFCGLLGRCVFTFIFALFLFLVFFLRYADMSLNFCVGISY